MKEKNNQQNKRKLPIDHIYRLGRVLVFFLIIFAAGSCTKPDELLLPGILERRAIEVSAPVSEIIVDLPVKVGDVIPKDTIVVQLDTEVAEAELKAHEAALAAAKALLTEASGEFQRQAKLRKANISTKQAYDKAKRQIDEARAQVAEKEARITQVKKRLADLTIRARVGGLLDQLPYELGERTPAGGVVAVIIATDKPWVRIWLPARAVISVPLGTEAKVKIEGMDNWLEGKVEYISREAEFTPHYSLTERESAHLVYETKVRLIAPLKDLPPGLPAQVQINIPPK